MRDELAREALAIKDQLLDALRARCAELEGERDDIRKAVEQAKVLIATVTQERDAARLVNSDLCRQVEGLQAERDAARAKRDAARAEVAHMKREQQAMIMQHRHDIRDLGQLLQDERCKVATIEAAWYAARAEVERLREDAARNRWCEEMRADVGWSQVDERWVVNVGERRYSHPDRNAAIDAARGKK